MKVCFGTPTTGSPRMEWCASAMQMIDHEGRKSEDDRLLDLTVNFQRGAYISKNRNLLTMKMYAQDCDALLQIDHDVCFPADILERMVEAMERTGVGVVAGNIALQLNAHSAGFEVDPETEGIHRPVFRAPGETEKLVGTIASSCVLVHRRVFDKISAHEGRAHRQRTGPPWFGPGTWWMLSPVWDEKQQMWIERGEDFSFSWRAREVGEAPMLLLWDLGLEHFKVARLEAPEPMAAEVPA